MAGQPVGTPEEAVQCLLRDLRSNVAPIVVLRKDGKIQDVWAVVGELEEDKYLQPGELQEIRYWSK
jgi:hypothetical protein